MRTIVLDTNFLLLPAARKIDIFAEIERIFIHNYKICIYRETIDELNKIIKEQRGKHKDAAKIGLQLITIKNVSILDSKQKDLYMPTNSKEPIVDDVILGEADSGIIVATQDKALRDALKKKGVGIIFAKNKKLETENVL
ncbi:MAG: PIN domain-containing protein [archaeon]